MTAPRAHRPATAPRSIALFGGTFDPVHSGHLMVAQAALRRFHLDAVYFIPAVQPPHKTERTLTPFAHRYAMVSLACGGHQAYFASLAEGPGEGGAKHSCYTIDTVRQFRRGFHGDHLYCILGADSFLGISTWRNYEHLLDACDFIVASRPGFRMELLRLVIPPEKLARTPSSNVHTIALRRSAVHLLDTVTSHVSSTEVRARAARGLSIHGLVPPLVEEYILKQALYLS